MVLFWSEEEMGKEINIDQIVLSPEAAAAWQKRVARIATAQQFIENRRLKTIPSPDERVQINGDGTITIFLSIPNILQDSMVIPRGQWSYRH
jgi:hypothetical protein